MTIRALVLVQKHSLGPALVQNLYVFQITDDFDDLIEYVVDKCWR